METVQAGVPTISQGFKLNGWSEWLLSRSIRAIKDYDTLKSEPEVLMIGGVTIGSA